MPLHHGRVLVSAPQEGFYLVIAPKGWTRDEELAGPAPIEPEPTSVLNMRAHFFNVEPSTKLKLGFQDEDGRSVIIGRTSDSFKLIGNVIEARPDIGPLFGGKPPQLSAEIETWMLISTIVLGAEGKESGKWRMQFPPNTRSELQDLPTELAERKYGWYFLRFYDTQENPQLVDSMDFRFIDCVDSIEPHLPDAIPAQSGHKCARFFFKHGPGFVINPVNQDERIQHIHSEKNQTRIEISPDKQLDNTEWLVGYRDGVKLHVRLTVPRFWWGIGLDNQEPKAWLDRPIFLDVEDFSPTSKKAIWISYPNQSAATMKVGFKQRSSRSFPITHGEGTLCIPLRYYEGTEELTNTHTGPCFHFWLDQKAVLLTVAFRS